MALKLCRECKSEVSSKAKTCPKCGISNPVKSSSSFIWLMFFGLIAFIAFSPKNEEAGKAPRKPKSEKTNFEQKSISKTAVELNTKVLSDNGKLIVRVKSNLPEGTSIKVSLANPINTGGSGYFGESNASLSSEKTADVGPFSQNGNPFEPGFYMVVVSISSLIQPVSVQSIIGNNGEHLKGNNVFMLSGVPARMVWQRYVFEISQDGAIKNFSATKNSEADSSLIPVQ